MYSSSTGSWQCGSNAPRLCICRCLRHHQFFDILQTGSSKADVKLDMTCRDGPGVPQHLTVGQSVVGPGNRMGLHQTCR